jgi:hypothetical protein
MTLAAWVMSRHARAQILRDVLLAGAMTSIACGPDPDAGPEARDARTSPTIDAATSADASAPMCRPAADCQPVDTLILALEPCCTKAIPCGYKLQRPEQLRGVFADPMATPTPDNPDNLCVSVSSLFRTPTPPEEKRVEVAGGEPIFYTPQCATQAILAYPFTGCCMPSGECGLATDVVLNSLSILAFPSPSPLQRSECTSAEKLNSQLRASSSFAGFAHLKDATGRCDYADLVARVHSVPKFSDDAQPSP